MKKTQRNRTQPEVRAKFDRRSGLVRLNVPLSVKADTIDLEERTFIGLAATWDEDLGSDIIHKGAFKKSISTWKSSNEAMPLLNSHNHFDIFDALGQALSMKETDEGLEIKWEVIEGEDGNRVLQRIRPSARTGRAIIGKMSIGFVPSKFEFEQPDGTDSFWDRKRHINEADLKEVSLVLFPMNPGASIDATTVKSFLQLAHDTNPEDLDGVARMELRRLNSRIGLLLKKQKPKDEQKDEEGEEESDDTQLPPSTQVPATGAQSDSDDDADETDLDDEEGDEEDTDESDATEKPEVTPPPKTEAPADDGEKNYVYQEALLKRLSKISLQQKVSDAIIPK